MITVRDARKQCGGRTLWDALSFDVAAGEVLALTGPSGAGKSTLLDCIGQIDVLDAGTVSIAGVTAARSGRRARLLRRDHLGYLFQDFGLVPDMTVQANVEIGRVPRRGGGRGLPTAAALERVGLAGRATDRAYELSGGEQQRVALARLLVKQPDVVLADEPTSALDEGNAQMVLDLLGEFAADGAAVVVATHVPTVVSWAASRLHLDPARAT
ncbi:ATP-binding cassette domain-containing protein [Curtobacterium sp. MCSS17_015]|uniref:ATP-binding cassette domain-containing protein n=1 Tax=Curtobacterium sp. MCSS17_015 TaxID=2175666 RepID=UPI000DA9294B|nr:ATP-binding cassette domain-containing protein [Curtobacterium sp. MCSS17_015]WIB26442.1 ATP-binding cassette domain-containing protein [Curtobacterium sp. MCSS17_015]